MLAVKEIGPLALPALKLVIIVLLLAVLSYFLMRNRIYRKGIPGRKLTLSERIVPRKVKITLSGDRAYKPLNIMMTVWNIGKREVDLYAPLLIFRRWGSKRIFRILTVGYAEIYPMLIDPGKESVVNISLEQFYQSVPELRRACRMSVEMKDDTGRKFRSTTIRLKWI